MSGHFIMEGLDLELALEAIDVKTGRASPWESMAAELHIVRDKR